MIGAIVWVGLNLVYFYQTLRWRDSLSKEWMDRLYNVRGPVWVVSMIALFAMLWLDTPLLWKGIFIDIPLSISISYLVWIVSGTLVFITPRRLHEEDKGSGG